MAKRGHPAKRKHKYTAKESRETNPAITNNIKAWRLKRYYNQEELAELLGVSRVTVSNWETGFRVPNDVHKMALCKVLDCSLYELFNWEV
jgi:transcriptional regulator with XRE-family HTH domain